MSQERILMLSGVFGLAALATALTYVLKATPYTMVLFMGGGSGLIAIALILFGFAVWRDLGS